MRLCLREVDRFLEEEPKQPGLVVLSGRTGTYPEAVALDIARRCLLADPKLALSYILVNDDPNTIRASSKQLAIDLEAEEESGRARIVEASSLSDAFQLLAKVPDDTFAIIDATSGVEEGFDLRPVVRVVRDTRVRKSNVIALVLVNPDTCRGGPGLVESLGEIADMYIKLEVIVSRQGYERILDVVYYKRGLIPYVRLHYTIRRGGIDYSLRVEV